MLILLFGCTGEMFSTTDASLLDAGMAGDSMSLDMTSADGGAMDGGRPPDGVTADGGGQDSAVSDAGQADSKPGGDFEPCTPGAGSMYNPTSASDVSDSANAGRTAVISDSFDCTACVFAAGQTVIPAGGAISGTNIDLNGACIVDNFSQALSPAASLVLPYADSRLSPEFFGAVSGDAIDDTNAIDALINNAEYAIGNLDGSYIKNRPSTYTRAGLFNWDMNGAKVEITSAGAFDVTRVSVDAAFDITNLSTQIFNGEFDGNEVYGRLFFLHGQREFAFNGLWVHDLFSPSPIRAVAFRFSINVGDSGFIRGEFRDNVIEDIVSEGNGMFNDTDGISKAWWYSMSGVDGDTSYSVLHQGNVVRNIIGDDAEALYAIQGGGTHHHNGTWMLDDEDYRSCTRRAVKFCLSNVTIQNSYIEEMPDRLFMSAQQVGSMVDFFSTQPTNLIENITVTGNTIKTAEGSAGHYHFVSLTEVDGAEISDNIIEMGNLENYAGLRLGSGTSSYRGILSNIRVTGNEFRNSGVQLLPQYAPTDQIEIRDNTFEYTYDTSDGWGAHQAALRCTSSSGSRGNIDFIDNEITVDVPNSTSLFNGVIHSNGNSFVNTRIEGVTISYLNAGVGRPFGYMRGNFGSSNTLENCTIDGQPGTGSLVVEGSDQSVVISNSFGDGSTPINVE